MPVKPDFETCLSDFGTAGPEHRGRGTLSGAVSGPVPAQSPVLGHSRHQDRGPHLYGRRNDSESLNRSLEDTLYLGQAHSLGWRRQQVEMLGWALMVNALSMARHRADECLEAAA